MTTEIKHSLLDDDAAFDERVRLNQRELRGALKDHYDFIVCGSGSSGSVVARRLAENSNVQVLLLDAGGWDDVPEVRDATRWPANYASERNWNFLAEPNPYLNGRRMPLAMGKVWAEAPVSMRWDGREATRTTGTSSPQKRVP